MKLATLRDDTRDGQLAVVSRDLKSAVIADGIVGTMQQVLDDWAFHAPQLEDLYAALNDERARNAFGFDPARCLAPLPRACQRLETSACAMPGELLLRQAASDNFVAPHADVRVADEAWGIDFETGIAIVIDGVSTGVAARVAADAIRLVLLINDWHLRELASDAAANGAGPVQSRPATAFSPVAVTPDELGEAWREQWLHRPLRCELNGQRIRPASTNNDAAPDFAALIVRAARTRDLGAGTIIGATTVRHGNERDAGLRFDDHLRIDLHDPAGRSIFGTIEQRVAALH